MKGLLFSILVLISLCTCAQNALNVLATNSWTAAYARAAGIKRVEQLAPSNAVHPSEYELQINDLEKIKKADLIIYAGYEVVFTQIQQSLKIDPKKFVKIETGYVEAGIDSSLLAIAVIAHTQKETRKSIERIHELFVKSKSDIEIAGLKNMPVIVHFFQADFAKEIGLKPVAVIGPAPLELHELGKLIKIDAKMVIDNFHNPIAQPLKEMKKDAVFAGLLNFPGLKNTETIEDVIRYNMRQLLDAENSYR